MKALIARTFKHLRPVAAPLAVAFSLAIAGCGGSGGSGGSGGPGGASQAQSPGDTTAAAGGRRRMGDVLLGLGLSDAQRQRIRDIMRDARAKSQNADPDTRRANYKAALAKIDTVLTPDQQKRFKAKMAEMRKQRGQSPQPQS